MFKNPELFSLPSLTIALRPLDLPNLFHHSVISLAEGGSRVEIANLQRNLTGKKSYLVAFHSPPISLTEPKTTGYLVVLWTDEEKSKLDPHRSEGHSQSP